MSSTYNGCIKNTFLESQDTCAQRRKLTRVGGGVQERGVISIEAYMQSTIFGEQYT